jgi:Tol biopolymer transport system component
MVQIRQHVVLAAFLAVTIGACSRATSPSGGFGVVSIESGNQQADTVGATLQEPLVVHVAGGVPGEAVVFATAFNPGGFAQAFLAANGATFDTSVTVSLDNALNASVSVRLGTQAGTATVAIGAEGAADVQHANFTTQPGAAVALAGTDTAIYFGTSATVHASLVDRFRNAITTSAAYTIVGGPASIAGNLVTSNGFGTALVQGTASGFTDTTRVSMVPTGTLAAASDSSGVIIFNLDGSGFRRLTPTTATFTEWSPTGTAVVFDQAGYVYTQGNMHGGIHIVDTAGVLTSPDTSRPASIADYEPIYSEDGTWIYFVKTDSIFDSSIWRMHTDGSAMDSLAGITSVGLYEYPGISSDGTQLTYDNGETILLQTVGSGGTATALVAGASARWSPTAAIIAYEVPSRGGIPGATIGSEIEVLPVGGLPRQVGSTTYLYDPSPNWSPDGNYIVARAYASRIDVISATTGEAVQLPFTGNVGFPSWEPGSGTAPASRAQTKGLRPTRVGARHR